MIFNGHKQNLKVLALYLYIEHIKPEKLRNLLRKFGCITGKIKVGKMPLKALTTSSFLWYSINIVVQVMDKCRKHIHLNLGKEKHHVF